MKRHNLIKARTEQGLSQETLAEKIGVSRETISKWENAKHRPHPYYRKKLCDALDIDDTEMLLIASEQQSITLTRIDDPEQKIARYTGQQAALWIARMRK